MFVSLPEFEITDLDSPAHSAARFWRGFGFSGTQPWLIATLHMGQGADIQVDTLCLWLERDLVPLLHIEENHGRLVGLQRMTPTDQAEGLNWILRKVMEVWVSDGRRAEEADVLLYRFDCAGQGLERLDAAVPPAGRRHRLLKSFTAA